MPQIEESIAVGIIGVGKMGQYHLAKALENSSVRLVGVYDSNAETRSRIQREKGVVAYDEPNALLVDVDAAIIASPTVTHFDIAQRALRAGVDILVEKPLTQTLAQAEQLSTMARTHKRILQVGFLERFRIAKLRDVGYQAESIQVQRLNRSLGRETNIDVISDLMIHDLDLVLSLIGEMPASISAWGESVQTALIDEAEVRLEFPSGATAKLRCSRVSETQKRELVLEDKNVRHTLDLDRNVRTVTRLRPTEGPAQSYSLGMLDPLADQLDAFIESVRTRREPLVGGQAGVNALYLVQEIQKCLRPASPVDILPISLAEERKEI